MQLYFLFNQQTLAHTLKTICREMDQIGSGRLSRCIPDELVPARLFLLFDPLDHPSVDIKDGEGLTSLSQFNNLVKVRTAPHNTIKDGIL